MIYLSTLRPGVGRAERRGDGAWKIEMVAGGLDVRCLAVDQGTARSWPEPIVTASTAPKMAGAPLPARDFPVSASRRSGSAPRSRG